MASAIERGVALPIAGCSGGVGLVAPIISGSFAVALVKFSVAR